MARYSEWGVCATSDCVLIKDYHNDSLQVGWIWKHAEVSFGGGDFVTVSLIQLGDLLEHFLEAGYAVWRLRASPEWCDLCDVVDSVAITWVDPSTVRTILPSHFKDL